VSFPSYVVVLTTLPDRDQALLLGESLVRERLAACAQVIGPVDSMFHWKGALERTTEWRLELKTGASRLAALERRLHELHPYDVPECITLPIAQGSDAYLRWLDDETASA
jgi:periplasmic divalent cation tolerance protein